MNNKLKHGDDFPFHKLASDNEHCAICNKKLGKNLYAVEVVDGGNIHAASEGTTIFDAGYMGFWFVGSECAKKFESGVLAEMDA